MEQMYGSPQAQPSDPTPQPEGEDQSSDSSRSSGGASGALEKVAGGAPGKIVSTGGLLMVTLLSLLLGLAYVVRSLKNVKLNLLLGLKRDDRAEKKY